MLLHSDGFDSHATGTPTLKDGDDLWGAQANVSIAASAGRFGGKSLQAAAAAASSLAFAVSGTNVAFAGWFKVGAATADNVLLADDNGPLLTRETDGTLVVQDGSGATRVTSAASTLPDDTYAWIEVSYRAGGVYLTVNGIPDPGGYTGAYTVPNYAALQLLAGGAGQGQVDVDDFLVWDDQGSYFTAYDLAPRRIQLLRPSADGDRTEWVPAGSSNWESVDAADWAGGAGVEATTNGQTDLYQFTDLAAQPGAVDAVVVKASVENTGSDPGTVSLLANDGTNQSTGAAASLSASQKKTIRSPFYRAPDGAAWAASTVNAAQFGQSLGL